MKIIRQRNSLQIFHLSSLVEQIRHDEDVALIFPGAVSVVWVTLGNNLGELQHICVRLQLMQFSVWEQQYLTWRHVLCIKKIRQNSDCKSGLDYVGGRH